VIDSVPHEVLDVEAVGAPGPGALLLLQPDRFLGDVGELLECRDVAAAGRDRNGASWRRRPSCRLTPWCSPFVPQFAFVINRIIT
jgi:hypothetical protein